MGNTCTSDCSTYCGEGNVNLDQSIVSDIQDMRKQGVAIDLDLIKDHKLDEDDVSTLTET